MKKVSVIVFEDAVLSALSGILDIFYGVNRFLEQTKGIRAFEIELVSEKMNNIQLMHNVQFKTQKTLDQLLETDLLIVPAFYTLPEQAIAKNQALIEKIRELYEGGTEIASICAGAILLAESGILSGKPCTTHWQVVDYIKERYPNVKVIPQNVVTDFNGVYTSGGAFSSFRLLLYLIEKYFGKELSIWASKMFSIDFDRLNQSHFVIFQGYKEHEDEQVLEAQQFIEKNYHSPLTVEKVAAKTNMSKRNFIRRFKSATKHTPIEYIHKVKVEAAKKDLEKKRKDINQVIYDVGYNDTKTFRKIFKRYTGLTPQLYRSKYNV